MICFQPSQSSSANPSSIEQIGYFSTHLAYISTSAAESISLAIDRVSLRLGIVKLGSGRVQGDEHLPAKLVAGLADGLDDHLERRGVALQVGREAAFVADVCGQLLRLEHLFEVVKDLAAATDRLGKALEAQRHDHELLHVHGVVGVLAAVDDVHHRGGQHPGADAAEIAEQRQPAKIGRRLRRRHRDAQNGIRAEGLLGFRSVQFDHVPVERDLIEGVHAAKLVGQLAVDVVNGLQTPRPR